MTTMAPAAVRFLLHTDPGELTGAPIYKVTDTLTGRLRLVTADLEEASEMTTALNNDQLSVADAILACEPVVKPVEYDG